MKHVLSILCIVALCLTFPACTATERASASAAVAIIPFTVNAKLAALIAKHPEARPYLVSVANAIESAAVAGTKLPTPQSLQNTVMPWVEFIPQVGAYAEGVFTIYSEAYPAIAPTAEALTAFAELIRKDAAPAGS